MEIKVKNRMPQLGKISPEIFEEIIYPNLGYKNESVITGPKHGIDCAVTDIGGGRVMAMTCDPFYIVPQYGWEKAAWFAFHILASDLATSGFSPQFAAADLNLPPEIKDEEFKEMWEAFSKECSKYKVSIVSGHTAKYAGCSWPMAGGGFMWSFGDKNSYVTPAMAREGDLIMITKGAAVEAAAIMACTFPEKVEEAFGEKFSKKSQDIFWQMSALEDCLVCSSYGLRDRGVTSMHDATECGVYGGIFEVARASQKGVKLYKDKIYVDPYVEKICGLFEMDPYSSISEGTLIITVKEKHADNLKEALGEKGIKSFICGEIRPQKEEMKIEEKGKEKELKHPIIDPFWSAFEKALKK
ncbi:MAG: AIR synthase family protein [Elusimicrobiota bacterium]